MAFALFCGDDATTPLDCTPGFNANANWESSWYRTEAETLSLRLGEMVFFLDLLDFWSGFAFGRGRMEAIFLEHLVKIRAVAAGKLGSA